MTDATNPFRPADTPPHGSEQPSPQVSGDPSADGPEIPGRREPTAAPAPSGEIASGSEVDLLDRLEADLAAVETAIATIERISNDGVGGEQAAVEIGAAVSVERFGGATFG